MRNRWVVYAIALGAVAIVGGWGILQRAQQAVEPPFSQEQLAQTLTLVIETGEAAQFMATLFDLADLEDYVSTAKDSAGDGDTQALENFARAQRADWPLYEQQMQQQLQQVLARARQFELTKPVFDGFSADQRRIDPATGRVIFGRFDVYMKQGEQRYTLEADMLRQTADGWKISGDYLRLYPTP